MSDESQGNDETDETRTQKTPETTTLDEQADALLADPQMKAALLIKMGLDDSDKTKSRGEDEVSSRKSYILPYP